MSLEEAAKAVHNHRTSRRRAPEVSNYFLEGVIANHIARDNSWNDYILITAYDRILHQFDDNARDLCKYFHANSQSTQRSDSQGQLRCLQRCSILYKEFADWIDQATKDPEGLTSGILQRRYTSLEESVSSIIDEWEYNSSTTIENDFSKNYARFISLRYQVYEDRYSEFLRDVKNILSKQRKDE
jgi:hypothetical protein